MALHTDRSILSDNFLYDEMSGRLLHAKNKMSSNGKLCAKKGDLADTYMCNRYRKVTITICGVQRQLLAHRVIWILFHGDIPDGMQVDHMDGNRINNNISNLRLVTNQENQHNRRFAKGFCWHKATGKWSAQIEVEDVVISLGLHDTELDARAAYIRAKRNLHPTSPLFLN
ncbi:HNH endonuclease signature motif containing protein [Phytobacter ursingii]